MKHLIAILFFGVAASSAIAQVIFYGGDFDGRSFLESARNTSVQDARLYDNFDNPFGFTVSKVFGNFLVAGALPSQLYYEFRTGVSQGNGGQLVTSGTAATTDTRTGRSFNGVTEWDFQAFIPTFQLPGGSEYWMTIAPIGNGSGHYYLSTTSGQNGVGSPIGDGNSFYDSRSLGANFAPTTQFLGSGTWDFSLGFGQAPEPGAWVVGLFGLGFLAFRRRPKAR